MSELLLGDWRYMNGRDGPIEVWDGRKWESDGNVRYDIQKPRILATATVDMLRFGPVPLWEVTVTGSNTDSVRTYQIDAATDDKAAQKGLDLFTEEMEALAYASDLSDNA